LLIDNKSNKRQQLLDFALITGRYLRESPITAVREIFPHLYLPQDP